MKKLATLLILFSLGLFTVGTIAGCGSDEKKTDPPATDDKPADGG